MRCQGCDMSVKCVPVLLLLPGLGKTPGGGRIWCVDNDSVYHCPILISLRLGGYQRKDRTAQAVKNNFPKSRECIAANTVELAVDAVERGINNIQFINIPFLSFSSRSV